MKKFSCGGDPRESVGGICESPTFKMAAVGQVDNCIFSVLAHIAALDLGSGVIWGKEFISEVSFIVLHTAYLESKFKIAVGHLNTILII